MARMKCAEWKPLGRETEPRLRKKNKIVIHTMVGTLRGTDSMWRGDGYRGDESHFGTSAIGECWQWQDTEFQADAQMEGNDDAISIENEDWGINNWRGNGPVPPFTQKQLDKLIELCTEICLEHDIPAVILQDSEDASKGIGTHRLGIDPYRKHGEHWSASRGKECPGDARIHQVNTIIIPAVAKNVQSGNKPAPSKPTGSTDPTTKGQRVTPHITDALVANHTYRKLLQDIHHTDPAVMELVKAANDRALADARALRKYEVKP